eukprot:3493068-Prymnesium_polylepis.5
MTSKRVVATRIFVLCVADVGRELDGLVPRRTLVLGAGSVEAGLVPRRALLEGADSLQASATAVVRIEDGEKAVARIEEARRVARLRIVAR